MFSLWEKESYLKNDLIIVGGGIVGLSVAACVLEKHPKKRVILLERGVLPTGASTKNAGFIATGSLTEFLEDIKKMGEEKSVDLFCSRYKGLARLLNRLGAQQTDAKFQGAYELIEDINQCDNMKIKYANNLLRPHFNKDIFVLRNELIEQFDFSNKKIKAVVENVIEGQIDSGVTMRNLYKHVTSLGALYLTGAEVIGYDQMEINKVQVTVKNSVYPQSNIVFEASNMVFCTNGFTNNLVKNELNLVPGRGQVLITKPISNLKFKGIFHLDEGYYYFRDFYGRVLLGGGRNTDFQGEQTVELGNTSNIMDKLRNILKETILPNTPFEIDYEWSGIMCFSKDGADKTPIIKRESQNVLLCVRMNGLGVALASNVGEDITNMLYGLVPSL